MAACCRGGVALRGWAEQVGGAVAGGTAPPLFLCGGRGQSCRRAADSQNFSQKPHWRYTAPVRPISSLPCALAPPTCLRYQTSSPLRLDPCPAAHCRQPIRALAGAGPLARLAPDEGLGPDPPPGGREGVSDGRTLAGQVPPGGALVEQQQQQQQQQRWWLLGPLTMVDGAQEDDIAVGAAAAAHAGASFRSLFARESCPAPFAAGGAPFYCFHSVPQAPPLLCAGAGPGAGSGAELRLLASGPSSPGGQRDREAEEKLALMYERLRGELPYFFLKTHDYSIYSQDVEFINGFFHTKTRGRALYQLSLQLCRLVCVCYFAEVRMEVLKLTQHREDQTVRARWRVRGLPLHLLLLRFYRRDKSELYRTYDAFSTFYLGADGLIHCHRVDKVMPAEPPPVQRLKAVLTGALVALGLQEPRPALHLLPLLLLSQLALRLGRGPSC